MNPSDNYRELKPEEIEDAWARCASAWQDPGIPERQFSLCVEPELRAFVRSEPIAPYDALVRCVSRLPSEMNTPTTTLLDVGCSSGYYSEVLKRREFFYTYFGCDYSPAFVKFARERYPWLTFSRQDATELDYADRQFPIVLSGGMLMCVKDYVRAIAECARVSSRYVIFHRTPVLTDQQTKAYVKEAYGVETFEWAFAADEIRRVMELCGLHIIFETTAFYDKESGLGHYTWLFEKGVAHYPV